MEGILCIWCKKPLSGKQSKFCSKNCCQKSVVSSWRKEMKIKAVGFLGGCCRKCGYKKCYAALTFHHRELKKSFALGDGHVRSWERIKKELAKCEILCRNCHQEEHHDCIKCIG